ncbi:MAG: hypothetical protein ACYCSQ_00185 [bacterium]
MSVRAHRIIEIKDAGESFNITHDRKLIDFLEGICDIGHNLNEDGCGIFDIPVTVLKQAINEVPLIADVSDNGEITPEYADLGLSEYIKNNIKQDIGFAEKNGNDYVSYYAY